MDEHFERCIHALEVRQQLLLSQLDEVATHQGTHPLLILSPHFLHLFLHLLLILFSSYFPEELVQDAQQQIQEAIHSCVEILKAGSAVYKKNKANAENIWQV